MLGCSGDHYAKGPRGLLSNPHLIPMGIWFLLGLCLSLETSVGSRGLICLLQPLNLVDQWLGQHHYGPAWGWVLTFGPDPRLFHALVRMGREAGGPLSH